MSENHGSTPGAALHITVRTLTLDDYETLCAVWAASGVGYQPTGRESREAMAAQMGSGVQTLTGAVAEGKIVGVAVLTHDGRKGWINRLGVLPEYQRRGVGRALVRDAELRFKAMDLPITAALVEHNNPRSLALFQAEGFEVHHTYYVTKRERPDV